ncbi:MAG: ribosomal L7Ae/L30e/S12e/Gadd45 family protein [Clostridia bacterium]|nr:ribosomal L7Ae/L30e/S12e/Gadd45 family protein [Clostridia bacterium]
MENKIYSFLGLATKARKLVSGEDGCEKAIKSGKVFLVIVAGDASDNTKKKFTNMCKYRELEIRFFGVKELLGRYTGKEMRSVLAVADQGFAKRLIELIDAVTLESGGEIIGKS